MANLKDSGPYATPEDKQTAKELGITVNALRKQRAEEDTVENTLKIAKPRRRKSAMDIAADACGLVKVRGALGGTYYE